MKVENKDDLEKWLRYRIEWFETNEGVTGDWATAWRYWHEAQSFVIALGLGEAWDVRGDGPPSTSSVADCVGGGFCDQVKRDFQDLLSRLEGGAVATPPIPTTAIPSEFRSKLLSLDVIARLHSGSTQSNPSQYCRRMVDSGFLIMEGKSGAKLRVVDIRGFPEAVQSQLLHKSTA